MSYATYTTEAIVCGTRDRNTTDRSFLLFTREGGMLYADARGVRREASKQRSALQDFTRVRVSLIKGKVGWRVGSVEALLNYYSQAVDRSARGSVVSLIKLVRRFARGEEPMPEVYDFVSEALMFLTGPVAERSAFDALVQVRFLGHLGYVALETLPIAVRGPLAEMGSLEDEHKDVLLVHLASAVEHSHL